MPLILLIGLPGSGKSTLAAQLQETVPQYALVSTDAVRGQLFGNEAIQGEWLLIWREVRRQLRQAVEQIHQGQTCGVIYDATNVVRRARRQLLAQVREMGFTHISGLWLDVPLEVCLERNSRRDRQVPEAVILRMHRCLAGAPPSLTEGLDCLMQYPLLHHFCLPLPDFTFDRHLKH